MSEDLKNCTVAKIGILIKTTLIDYPERVACTFFLKGCNLKCPYCYNTELVNSTNTNNEEDFISLKDLFSHLEKRKNVLTGFVISGGEALLNPFLPQIILKAKKLGYKVKLDTNGTLPKKLEQIIENPETKPDFIAIDIKTSISRYNELQEGNFLKNYEEEIKKSIELISKYDTNSYEFRTVLVPNLVTKADIENIAKIIPNNSVWNFAPFLNNNCINEDYTKIKPYTYIQMEELVDFAKTFIPNAKLR